MLHSTVTSRGQTTIPAAIRAALGIKAGDKLDYAIMGDCVTLRVHPRTRALKGALAKGRRMSIAQVRAAASRAARRRKGAP